MPKFSIIIPVYNVAPYLRECLDSVLAQTFADWEAICVDDGSTDGSGAILDEYAAKDMRVRIIHQENAGVSAARNVAMSVARGWWICFVDGDDAVATNWLHVVAETIDANPDVDWVRIGWRYWDGGERNVSAGRATIAKITHPEMIRWGWSTLTTGGFVCMNFVRTDLARFVGFDRAVHLQEDMHFALKLLTCARAVVINNAPLYYYRQRPTSAWLNAFPVEHVIGTVEAYLSIWQSQRGEVAKCRMDKRLACGITRGVTCVIDRWSARAGQVTVEDRRRVLTLARQAFKCGALRLDGLGRMKELVKWGAYLVSGLPAALCPKVVVGRFVRHTRGGGGQ